MKKLLTSKKNGDAFEKNTTAIAIADAKPMMSDLSDSRKRARVKVRWRPEAVLSTSSIVYLSFSQALQTANFNYSNGLCYDRRLDASNNPNPTNH